MRLTHRNMARWRAVAAIHGPLFRKPSKFHNHYRGGKLGMELFCLLRSPQGNNSSRIHALPASKYWRALAGAGLALMLTACASNQNVASKPPEPAPQMVSMEEWMARARLAATEGNPEKGRAAYRAAAQDYPGEKLPWLKLAEDYFNAQDYGNAVIAAQEVLQRDMQDHFAHSVLVVSGLRLTAGSLVALRQDGNLPVGSRDEAISVARALRDTLGAASLLPPAPPANAPRPRKPTAAPGAATTTAVTPASVAATAIPATSAARGAQRSSAQATGTVAVPGVVPTVSTPAAPQAPAKAPAATPFDKLK
ncbi:tetratricopeptide repeat protein [Azohydromonas lata]|uniref:Tetratricopeptide repeat protein n=1 Tax=Azohydromonas lata TaxID=45677 RepID=A0ABU5IAQ1_9BURK|nr:tetratricopeptide repeat protein [Azohydromonas lata]MDZ5456007.1 hypothetical protein [Azohydromonas lata]